MKKRDIFRETKIKIIIISTAIVFLSLFILAILTQVLYTSRVFANVDRELNKQKNILELGKNPAFNEDVDFQMKNKKPFIGGERWNNPAPPNMIVSIYEGENLIYLSPNAYFNEESKLPAVKGEITKVDFNNYRFRAISSEKDGLKINFYINVDSAIQSVTELMNSLILGLIILLVIAIFLSTFLASKIIKPVKESYDKQVFFVQDASHEMRTPLAIIKGKIEILAKHYGDTIEEHFEEISEIMSEIKSLEKLNNDLLLLSKEDINNNLSLKKVKIEDFLTDIVEFYEDLSEIQQKEFKVLIPKKDITVNWDCEKVKRMIIILLENAFKYTEEESTIELSIEELNRDIKIVVRDTGISMEEEEIKRVFDRFYRSDIVRAKNISGSGIGLSLLKSMAKSLNIKIDLKSKIGEGTEFTLIIPKEF